ncbi:Co/Zn/Cd efflux system component protein [Chondrocystis sp. NIES-4102]|nr:Co/Zn/Cd efflux system component protein [Chondrocystis sp. NIES-4102]
MHKDTFNQWQHSHDFSIQHQSAERNTSVVMWLTAVTMVIEIITGSFFGSMALLADGWHMATHVAAFGIAVFAYRYARRHANNSKYTFGTGKVTILGGYTSAITLAVTALTIAIESMTRFFQPQEIRFNEAIAVAILGLVINLISAWLLQDHDHHDHHHHHDHHDHHHHDSNLKAAYIHVVTDALTSILAIIALIAGKYWGWIWLDAVMGLIGAGVISKWSYGLVKDTGAILLDGGSDKQTKLKIMTAIEADADNRVTDLHVWYVSQNSLAATISLVTHHPQPPQYYKSLLSDIASLVHIIIEVNPCQGEPCQD